MSALRQEARSRRADARCTLDQRSLEASIPLLVLRADGLARKPMRQMPYSSKVQQRPLTNASQRDRQHTALARTTSKRPAAPLVRDEEAVHLRPDSTQSCGEPLAMGTSLGLGRAQ
jgi:hypothetical protein